MTNDQINDIDFCFNLRKATRIITKFYDGYLSPSGLRSTQLNLLLALQFSGNDNLTEISDKLGMDRTTLTRNLRPLLKSGLVSVFMSKDKKNKHCCITGKGGLAIEEAKPLWEKAQKEIVEHMGNKRYNLLLTELKSINFFEWSSEQKFQYSN